MKKDLNFRNMVDDPYLNRMANKPFKNCCGLAATGDGAADEQPLPVPKVQNVQAWGFIKTALAVVGAWVVIKYAYGKLKK